MSQNHQEASTDLLQIGFLYNHIFGKRVINHLINKSGYCQQCGPLCINCRELYPWFAGKIQYALDLEIHDGLVEDLEATMDVIREKLVPLDVLVIIALPSEVLDEIPALCEEYHIRAIIMPVEDPKWISSPDQFSLQSQLQQCNIEFNAPHPFCSLEAKSNQPLIKKFCEQFRIGVPQLEFSIQKGKILKTKVLRSAPCGATYYLAQYLRNEQLNEWNTQTIDERINYALDRFPCIAAKNRDPIIQKILRVSANEIAQETTKSALNNAEELDSGAHDK